MARPRYIVSPIDGSISTDDLDTAVALSRHFSGGNGAPRGRAAERRQPVRDASDDEQRRMIVAALRRLQAGPVTSKALAVDLKLKPKGLAALPKRARRLLAPHGIKPDEVWTTDRNKRGRTWAAGPRLAEAIAALDKAT